MIQLQRLLVVLLVIASIAMAVQLARLSSASAQADLALGRLESTGQQINAVHRLHAQTPAWAKRARPALAQGGGAGGASGAGGGLATAVNDCLAAAGVPQSALASLSPAGDTPIAIGASSAASSSGSAGVNAVRRRAVLTLAPITLPQVGKVLDGWRSAHPDCTITSIDLAPEPIGRREPPPGSDLPLRAVISIETLFVTPASSGARS